MCCIHNSLKYVRSLKEKLKFFKGASARQKTATLGQKCQLWKNKYNFQNNYFCTIFFAPSLIRENACFRSIKESEKLLEAKVNLFLYLKYELCFLILYVYLQFLFLTLDIQSFLLAKKRDGIS